MLVGCRAVPPLKVASVRFRGWWNSHALPLVPAKQTSHSVSETYTAATDISAIPLCKHPFAPTCDQQNGHHPARAHCTALHTYLINHLSILSQNTVIAGNFAGGKFSPIFFRGNFFLPILPVIWGVENVTRKILLTEKCTNSYFALLCQWTVLDFYFAQLAVNVLENKACKTSCKYYKKLYRNSVIFR